MNVTLKPETEKLVRERIASGDFKNASELVDHAIRYLLKLDRAEAELEMLIQEGIDSGPATEMTPEEFDAVRREIHAKDGRKEE
jgi:antitoxin ParD1/3/4